MANKNRRNSWESSLLAAALAIAGSLFLFDKLGSLMQNGTFSFAGVIHAAPMLIAVLGATLLLADRGTAGSHSSSKEGGHD